MKLPSMKMPEAEAALIREQYTAATTILEYGSGGSTVFAAGLPGRYVVSVESDRDWCNGLRQAIEANGAAATVHLHHADIGPTGAWGAPLTAARFRDFPAYSLGVWDLEIFRQPDVVLIDGRARSACFLATLFRTRRDVTVLVDDYLSRPSYATVMERYARPVRTAGRMAMFELQPRGLDPVELMSVASVFSDMEIDRTHIGRRLERFAKGLLRT